MRLSPMRNVQSTINLILKALAVGMSVAAVVLGILGTADVNVQVNLLGMGLFALSLATLRKEETRENKNE
jgi:hypothetical protein